MGIAASPWRQIWSKLGIWKRPLPPPPRPGQSRGVPDPTPLLLSIMGAAKRKMSFFNKKFLFDGADSVQSCEGGKGLPLQSVSPRVRLDSGQGPPPSLFSETYPLKLSPHVVRDSEKSHKRSDLPVSSRRGAEETHCLRCHKCCSFQLQEVAGGDDPKLGCIRHRLGVN